MKDLSAVQGTKEYQSCVLKNKYYKKRFSILGDSISTLEGFNPDGYNVFYKGEACVKARVHSKNDCWWGKVISFFGGELLVNNSWSGSRVAKLPDNERLFPSGCSDERTSSLHSGSVFPDIIIVYLGTNDWAYGSRRADEDRVLPIDDMEYFDDAYSEMLKKLKLNYPFAEIWCCTLSESYMSSNQSFQFPHKYAGIHIEDYNDIIRKTAQQRNCKLIDLYSFRTPYDSIDGSHPNFDGMNTLAFQVVRIMCEEDNLQLLNCFDNVDKLIFNDKNEQDLKEKLIKCFRDTIDQVNKNPLLLINTKKAIKAAKMYYPSNYIMPEISRGEPAEISVIENTTFDAARLLTRKYGRVAVLNFASAVNPGGGVTIGAMAQEECLCRSSNLLLCLKLPKFSNEYYMYHRTQQDYMYSDRIIYTNNITVFKSDDDIPELLPENEWLNVDVITCAAPNLSNNGNVNPEMLQLTFKRRIMAIIRAAVDNNIEAIVLGAFGCGAFKNPPKIVASAFKEVLLEDGYGRYFKEVVFAIKHSDGDNINFETFDLVFNGKDLKEIFEQTEISDEEEPSIEDVLVTVESEADEALEDENIIADNEKKAEEFAEPVPKFCRKCGDELIENSKFCQKCGNKVTFHEEDTDECASCGEKVPVSANYCPYCAFGRSAKSKKDDSQEINNELPDTYIDIRYKIIREIGKGGSSRVYLANDEKLDRRCAVKIVPKNSYTNKIASQMLLEEANKMKFLHHISIPQLYDILDEEKRLCIIMEYIEGETLEKVIRSTKNPLSEKTVVDWAKQLCKVLTYLHSLNPPRIFRDIKPSNIMLQPNGEIKLFDFGIMRVYDSSKETDTCNLGTKGFAAPEQFSTRGQSDARTDIYALGITMHYLLTGINPTKMEDEIYSISTYRPELTKALDDIIQKCTQHNPDDRYQNCKEVLSDLEEYEKRNGELKNDLQGMQFAN